mmetsp:Transcript_35541/g.61423  ORF Transcript_35541/g.61423 Transcript_35541/m.61423 type:complete len:196 (-) Transcript_35541:312-899(-)
MADIVNETAAEVPAEEGSAAAAEGEAETTSPAESAAAEDAAAGETTTQAENALRENIAQKGNNAYYYAHAHKIDAPVWDGHAEPRLLKKQASSEAPAPVKRPISKYAWNDEKDKVKIYISLDSIGEVADDAVTIENTENSLTLVMITSTGASHQLLITKLYDNITAATFRKKPDKVIVTLKKASSFSWHDLKKKD